MRSGPFIHLPRLLLPAIICCLALALWDSTAHAQVRPLVLENPSRNTSQEAPPLLPPREAIVEEIWEVPALGNLLPGMLGGPGGMAYGLWEGRVVSRSPIDGTLQWQVDVPGLQWGPQGLQGRLFVAGAGTIHALNPADGSRFWSRQLQQTLLFPPLLAADRVIVVLESGDVVSLNSQDGTETWRITLTCLPEVSGGLRGSMLVFGCPDGEVQALDSSNGGRLWSRLLPLPIITAPAITKDSVYAGTTSSSVVNLKARNGKVRYRARLGGNPSSAFIPHADLLLVGSLDNLLYAFKLKRGNLAWSADIQARALTAPTIRGNAAAASPLLAQRLVILDLRDGAILTRENLPGQDRISAGSPVFAGQTLVTATRPTAGGPGWLTGLDVTVQKVPAVVPGGQDSPPQPEFPQ